MSNIYNKQQSSSRLFNLDYKNVLCINTEPP